ncbi:MAG: phosphate acyltransferase PlsX [Chloroflexi bacterium]|nr:phosphate acyltransferase PlsX [Chloroflexota bacterium]
MVSNGKVRIAVDAMGGDYAPEEIVKGVVQAAKTEDGVEISLVGVTDILSAELDKNKASNLPIRVVHADEYLRENDKPALSARRQNTSVAMAARAVKAGEADALISAGPTAALVSSALKFMGMIDGIERPVIGGALSTFAPNTVLMDCGVNVDCKPYHMLTFAIVGSIYARKLLNIENPKVALLNIGAEEGKGNDLVRESYALLQRSGLNFIGNIEGNEILSGKANVIVCDGFVGNVLFKFCEGGFEVIHEWLKGKLKHVPFAGLIKSMSKDLTSLTSTPQSVGSGLIWGIDGLALKMHGHTRAPQVAEKIAQVKLAVNMDVIGSLKSELAAQRKMLKV